MTRTTMIMTPPPLLPTTTTTTMMTRRSNKRTFLMAKTTRTIIDSSFLFLMLMLLLNPSIIIKDVLGFSYNTIVLHSFSNKGNTAKTTTTTEIKFNQRNVCRLANSNNYNDDFETYFGDSNDKKKTNNNDNNDDDDFSFMASLQSRLKQVQEDSTKLPLVVLDSMLPRQVLKIHAKNPLLMELVADRIRRETPFIGMMGLARLRGSPGRQVHLRSGVEVEIVNPKFVKDDNDNENEKKDGSGTNSGGGIIMELHAGRRFRIVDGNDSVTNTPQGWTEARVQFLDSQQEEENEIKRSASSLNISDRLSVARAIAKCTEWTSPNMNTINNQSLIDQWVQLAKTKERQSGQIDRLLQQLGEIPPPEQPSERAFWVGALINPIPAMGVALEIRPALLSAKTAEERVLIASDGLLKSIKHMDGSAPLW